MQWLGFHTDPEIVKLVTMLGALDQCLLTEGTTYFTVYKHFARACKCDGCRGKHQFLKENHFLTLTLKDQTF